MKKRLLVSWEGSDGGADLAKTAKRLIKSQVIKWQRPGMIFTQFYVFSITEKIQSGLQIRDSSFFRGIRSNNFLKLPYLPFLEDIEK